jgi:ATP-binding cassette, subfamily B, multidrug efflux pump
MLGILFVVASNYFAIDGIVYAREAVDYIKQNASSLERDVMLHQLFIYALKILGVALLSGLFLFFMRQTIIVMSRLIEYDLKNEIFSHYQQLDISFYKRNNTGDLMNRISEDVGRVRMYIGPAIMYVLNTLARFVLTITIMLHVNTKLTLYALIPLPILAIAIYVISDLINKKSTKIQEQLSVITSYTQEAFSGIRVLKSYGREAFSVNEFASQSEQYRQRNIGLILTEALFQPSMLLLIGISNIIIVYIGGRLVISGELTYGNIIEFILYINALTWPIASLGWVTSLIQRAAASQTRINEFLLTQSEISNQEENSQGQNELIKEIEFKNVSFQYSDTGIWALKNISFKLKQGQSLAIIGKTASGKSTIAHLLCRLYDATEGEILINNKNIKSIPLHDYRAQIGYVPQDVFLFSDTITNNIGFSIDEDKIDDSVVVKAAQNAAVHSNIETFPQQYKTLVGERGITLSGGQKQRISIARALIKKPQVLIFDDCLSAVDTETEEEVLTNLKKEMQNKTSIIISHRISTVKHADYILVLDNGAIVEQGTHRQLLQANGSYHQLYQMQLLEEEV